jgi:hypothetical protein
MNGMVETSDALARAAATLETALIRSLADGEATCVRVRAPAGCESDPACLLAAALASLAELHILFPRADSAMDLPPALFSALGPKAVEAAARTAGFAPERILLDLDEQALAGIGEDALEIAERLKARGFRLSLKCAVDAPMGLSQRARDVFCAAQAPAKAALAAAGKLNDVWTDPMARRLLSAKAAGLSLTAENADPDDVEALADMGFTAACFAAAA